MAAVRLKSRCFRRKSMLTLSLSVTILGLSFPLLLKGFPDGSFRLTTFILPPSLRME